MSRNLWVETPRKSDEEIEREIQEFLNRGGEIIKLDENFNPNKKNSDTAVKLGDVYRKLRAAQKK